MSSLRTQGPIPRDRSMKRGRRRSAGSNTAACRSKAVYRCALPTRRGVWVPAFAGTTALVNARRRCRRVGKAQRAHRLARARMVGTSLALLYPPYAFIALHQLPRRHPEEHRGAMRLEGSAAGFHGSRRREAPPHHDGQTIATSARPRPWRSPHWRRPRPFRRPVRPTRPRRRSVRCRPGSERRRRCRPHSGSA